MPRFSFSSKAGREAFRVLVTMLVLYLAVVVYYYAAQRSYLYYPDTSRPDAAVAGLSDVTVATARTADGLDLNGWYLPPAAAGKPVIVLFHGNGGSIVHRGAKARMLLAEGYGVLLAEYRGYGGNPGKPSEKGFYEDARAWLSWLVAQGVAPADTVLYGESIGSGPAVQMAADNPGMKGLVLETPFASLAETAQGHMMFLPVRLLMIDRFDNLSKIGRLKMPVLILHGQADVVVPYKQGKRLYDAAPEPKFLETYPLGGHNDLYGRGAGERVLRFLEWLERE